MPERRSGLPLCRISWLEHGKAIPTLPTFEKIVDAVEIPIWRLVEKAVISGSGLVPSGEETKPQLKCRWDPATESAMVVA